MKSLYLVSIAMLFIAAIAVAGIHLVLNLKDVFGWHVVCPILSFGFVTLAIGLAFFAFGEEYGRIGENKCT